MPFARLASTVRLAAAASLFATLTLACLAQVCSAEWERRAVPGLDTPGPGTRGSALRIGWQRRRAGRLRLNVRMAFTHLRSFKKQLIKTLLRMHLGSPEKPNYP